MDQIDWHVPEELVPRYATNIVVQASEFDFLISFFAISPPILFDPPAADSPLPTVRADCVARVIVPRGKMPEFIKVFQESFEQFSTMTREQE